MELNKLLGIKAIRTTAYHLQANGMVERIHCQLNSSPVIVRAPRDVHSMEGGPRVLGGRPGLRVSAPPSRRVPTSAPPICIHIRVPQGPTRVHGQRHSATSNAPWELSNVSFLRPLQHGMGLCSQGRLQVAANPTLLWSVPHCREARQVLHTQCQQPP